MPRVIGLTGGIASGKSTVADILRQLGAEVIDADQVARAVVAPGLPAFDDIVREFGAAVLADDGALDRKKLGAIVFADDDQRRRLNRIVHPRVAEETARRIAAAAARGVEVVVYEAALLVENQLHRMLQGLIVVSAPPEAQLARVVSRDRLTGEEARQRAASQAPLADKIAAADFVIDNSGPPDALRPQVEAVWRRIQGGEPRQRGE